MRVIAALLAVIAVAGVAFAQAPHSFDGTYVGVSAQFLGNMRGGARGCPQFRAPAPISISNGHAQGRWGEAALQGDVTPQGGLTMRTGDGRVMTGQIDGQFVLRGQMTALCSYNLMWQRR